GLGGGDGAAVVNAHAHGGERVELRDVFHPAAVRHRGGERDVQLHEEMRAYRDVERLGEVGHLQPGRDAADARDVDLDDTAGLALQVLAEMRHAVDRFADGNRQARRRRETDMAAEVFRRQWLLVPGEVKRLVEAGAPDSLVDGGTLVAVHHDLEAVADGFTHRRKPYDVLMRRASDLDLGAAEARRFRAQRIGDELVGI